MMLDFDLESCNNIGTTACEDFVFYNEVAYTNLYLRAKRTCSESSRCGGIKETPNRCDLFNGV
jgi:hypothetical protein